MKRLSEDKGNALLEGVGFAAVAFALLLTLGLNLLTLEREQLAIRTIARNAMRSFLLHNSDSLLAAVDAYKKDSILASRTLAITVGCSNNDCITLGNLVWLEITSEELKAKAFGVISE